MRHIERDDWAGVGELMLDSAAVPGGCRRASSSICPDNTIHQALPQVLRRTPLPWLHIAEVVARRGRGARLSPPRHHRHALAHRQRRLPELRSPRARLAYLRPTPAEREEINRIIFEELVRGVQKVEAVRYLQEVFASLARRGCDAVVLGCTEIPLLMSDGNSPLPTLDSTRLLARACARSPRARDT